MAERHWLRDQWFTATRLGATITRTRGRIPGMIDDRPVRLFVAAAALEADDVFAVMS